MLIKITSHLTDTQRKRLARHIERDHDRQFCTLPVSHVGRNIYRVDLYDVNDNGKPYRQSPHDTARHLMVIAGTQFDYTTLPN